MRCRAQVLVGPTEFALREIDVAVPGRGELRLLVHACGVCGSDKFLAQICSPGTILGHEVVAEVEAVGEGVDGWQVGDRAIPLGEGLGMSELRGGYGEAMVISADACVPVPAHLPSASAVIAEPMGNGLHFVRRGRLRAGQRVAILGAGQIGLSMIWWARRLGAARIVATEPVAARAARARTLGADAVIDATREPDVPAAVFAALGGPPEIVLEATGRADVMTDAIQMAGQGGVVVLAGITPDAIQIQPLALCLKEVDLVFPIGTVRAEVEETLAALASGDLDARQFVTHRIELDDLPAAIRSLGHPTDQVKVVVDYKLSA